MISHDIIYNTRGAARNISDFHLKQTNEQLHVSNTQQLYFSFFSFYFSETQVDQMIYTIPYL